MNSKLSFTYLILLISPLFFACSGPAKEDKKKNGPANSISLHFGDEKYFTIDTAASEVIWSGSAVKGKHDGYAYISKGELLIENNQVAGGTVEIDMKKTEGPGHDKNNNLIDHLKGPDFFDVKKFPFSTIVITRIATVNGEQKKVTGNLTIKDITRQVTFPARIQIKARTIKAEANLIIDRTEWGIRYNSGKFYDNLADKAISDSIEFNIKILAKKQS